MRRTDACIPKGGSTAATNAVGWLSRADVWRVNFTCAAQTTSFYIAVDHSVRPREHEERCSRDRRARGAARPSRRARAVRVELRIRPNLQVEVGVLLLGVYVAINRHRKGDGLAHLRGNAG